MTEAPAPTVTEDRLLGGRVILRQPADGFRAAIDPIFLAAACPAKPRDVVLDLGAGTGAASLCLARRLGGVRVVGLEMQRDLVRLGTENVALNQLETWVSMMVGDLVRPPPRLAPAGFDHVIANPPFLEAGAMSLPAHPGRAQAVAEGDADLAAWVRFALAMVRVRGSITFIHRADRLEVLLAELRGRAGEIVVYPLWPATGKPAKRVLVRARPGIATPTRLAAGLVLHEADGRFTAAAEAVLRNGEGIVL